MSEPILEVRYRVLVGVVAEGIYPMDLKEVIRAISTDHLFQIHRVDTLVHHADPTPDIGLQEWVRSWAAEYLLEQRL